MQNIHEKLALGDAQPGEYKALLLQILNISKLYLWNHLLACVL